MDLFLNRPFLWFILAQSSLKRSVCNNQCLIMQTHESELEVDQVTIFANSKLFLLY